MVTPPPAHDTAAIAEIAKGLTKAQRAALQDSPGNPDYCRGAASTMAVLEEGLLVQYFNPFATNGKRSGPLTPLGLAVRASLAQSKGEE